MRSGAPGTSSKSSFRYVVRISVVRRLCAKTMSCRFRFRNSDAMRRVSPRYDRRIHEHEELLASRRAGLFHDLESLLCQPFCQLAWIRDGRRRTDECRRGSVVTADSVQASQHLAEMAAENASIRMQLVDDDVLQ